MRWRCRIRRIVEAPTRWPSSSSSPWGLTYPQRGFSRAIRTTKSASTSSVRGLWVPRTASLSLISTFAAADLVSSSGASAA